jgi:hypothetical protein
MQGQWMSVWERVSRQAPALVALCIIVILSGGLNWKIAQENMKFQRAWAVQVNQMSEKCHDSHAKVSIVLAAVLDRNSDSIDALREHEQATGMTMSALKSLIERMNGRMK